MKIKKLIINGFKSFGEKTEIEFDENLIGIVGPNGSGKSNIIDAIRWVLGQQKTSELRTKANTDVIFSGSDNKSAKNVAEVTIVFDNEDGYLDIEYQEVSIKRRLYRSGESEYYLNNSRCRLIDINNLILDKGFGKDSYSIISQGKVEEIIMAKPDKRRELIDEVAGISKYKYKKKITLNKLNSLNNNLEKIEFILNEIQQRIEPLEKEKNQAIKYKEIKKVLEVDEKSLFVNKIMKNNNSLESLEINLINVKSEIEKKNKILEQYEEKLKEIDDQILKEQNNIAVFNQHINEFDSKRIHINNEINLITQKKELHKANDQEILIKNLREKINKIIEENNEFKEQKISLEPELQIISKEIEKLKSDYYINQNKLYELKQKEEELKQKEKINKNPYHIQKLIDLNINGVIGTVRENMSIFSKYEMAINTILGSRKNEIIVENEHIVKELIDYLKKNKLGKATFAPINKIKPRYIDNETLKLIENMNEDIVLAIDCIKVDPKLTKVFSGLVGNILIVENIEVGNKVNKVINNKYQIVTLQGEVFYTTGKISGGYDKNNNHLSKENLNDIIVKLKELEYSKNKQNEKLEKLTIENSEKNIKLDLINNKLENNDKDKKTLELEYNMLVENSGDTQLTSIQDLEQESKEVEGHIYEIKKKKTESETLIKDNIKEKEQKNQEVLDINASFKMLIKEETEDSMKIERLKEESKYLIDELREKYNISFQKAYDSSVKIYDIEEQEKKIKVLKREIKELGFVNLDAIEEYKVQKERLDFYTENKDDLLKSKDKIEGAIHKIDEFVVSVFLETFEKLNKEFKIIFEQLFDGGSAFLRLTDEDNILSTGVEIIAKPPGKKSQVIGLLSGGEKALTAIALLFAILKIRVVPFSILDEVEAALDEANVVKYIEYLRIFSQKTQFILITHRQTTMEKIDKLYGVTMVEKGISSVIDIKLKEDSQGEKDV